MGMTPRGVGCIPQGADEVEHRCWFGQQICWMRVVATIDQEGHAASAWGSLTENVSFSVSPWWLRREYQPLARQKVLDCFAALHPLLAPRGVARQRPLPEGRGLSLAYSQPVPED